MRITDNQVDLSLSFMKLAREIVRLEEIHNNEMAYIFLKEAVLKHINECTLIDPVPAANPDDLKDVL